MKGRLTLFVTVVTILLGWPSASTLSAHPMPNTVIAVSIGDDGATFDIAVPVPELRLAMPGAWPPSVDLLSGSRRSEVAAYFDRHFSVLTEDGEAQPHVMQSLTSWQAAAASVGAYQELRIRMFVAAGDHFDPRHFLLKYDGVLHQVANHIALVQVAQDFRGGLLNGDEAVQLGFIRFDLARGDAPPLLVSRAPGSLWRGLRTSTDLGFHHVATGFDHVLFLITLLVVAPLRAVNGRWSLFQGWAYTARRFLAISAAFTAGHSVALLLGTYRVVPVPAAAIEVLIAASILLAAIHAIRPLFSGREWLVAGAFGIVHGLAFSESLASLTLVPWARALAVLGFNVGVEGAQLVAMACALPLLAASRWRVFDAIRVVTMSGAVLVAGAWLIERASLLLP